MIQEQRERQGQRSKSQKESRKVSKERNIQTKNSEAHDSAQTIPRDDSWSYAEWNDDWSLLGWQDGWNQSYGNSASSPSHGGSFDLGAMSSPEWSEWLRMDFDTGAAVNTFLLNFGR